ncbi:MAG TPA: hypothetical protein ENI23_13995 [bacterium]|nr:hypothetical protein [bacterium]
MSKTSWKKKIRNDYKDILSEEQVEATIQYWEEIIDTARSRGAVRGFSTGYAEGVKKLPDSYRKGFREGKEEVLREVGEKSLSSYDNKIEEANKDGLRSLAKLMMSVRDIVKEEITTLLNQVREGQ